MHIIEGICVPKGVPQEAQKGVKSLGGCHSKVMSSGSPEKDRKVRENLEGIAYARLSLG